MKILKHYLNNLIYKAIILDTGDFYRNNTYNIVNIDNNIIETESLTIV